MVVTMIKYIVKHHFLYSFRYIFFFQLPFLPELNFKLDDFSVFDKLFTSERNPSIAEDAKQAAEAIVPYKYVFSQPGEAKHLYFTGKLVPTCSLSYKCN